MQKYAYLDEESLERLVAQALAPAPPPDTLRHRVLRQTRLAWDRYHAQRPSWFQRWFGRSNLRLVWSAAAFLFIALLAAVFLPAGGESLTGTVLGESELAIGFIIFVTAVGLVVFLWRRKGKDDG